MAVQIRPRSEWTSAAPGFTHALTAANVVGAAIHYPGDGDVVRLGTSEATSKALLAAYRRYHVQGRGWSDIGYNIAVDQAGRVWYAAGLVKAAHCASAANPYANARYVGILAIVGNNEEPSPALIASVNSVLRQMHAKFVFDAGEVRGHRDVYGAATSCPGGKLSALIADGTIGLDGPTTVGAVASGGSGSSTAAAKNARAHRSYKAGEVLAIQRKLAAAGFYGGLLDDDYGAATEAAVRAYQTAQLWPAGYLAADGDWGPGSEGHFQWVVKLQAALNGWKSSYIDLVVDGSYGALTSRRVEDVQKRNVGGAYRIEVDDEWVYGAVDGVPGAVTCGMLGIPTHP